MNDFLDTAAVRSAHAVRAVSQTAFVGRLRYRAAVVKAVAETFWELTEPKIDERLRQAATVAPVVVSSRTADDADLAEQVAAPLPAHGPLPPAPPGSFAVGDDEKCSCRGTGDQWCGATKRDVVHDLMTTGAQLSAEQAEFIWTSAQARRAERS
ncbi:MAG: hypothetical protein JWP75_1680 [Frondihabitans sp.]|nr:hypothetical protein [Frondihabitans sp.]